MLDESLMALALEKALLGIPHAFPNPLVGAVIVTKDGKVFSDYHRRYRQKHAEVNVIGQLFPEITSKTDFSSLNGASLYVNLEPCSIHNNTPPCVDLISRIPFSRIIIADLDPNPLILGQGVEKLRRDGYEIITGVLSDRNRILNRRFFTFHQKRRPYIILKWAESSNGSINSANNKHNSDGKWFTSEESRRKVHELRGTEMSVLVGANTVIEDDPLLNVRYGDLPNPLKLILDPNLRVNYADRRLSDDRVIVFNLHVDEVTNSVRFVKIVGDYLTGVLNYCYHSKILSILVEGGKTTLESFLKADIYDEIYCFVSPKEMEGIGIDNTLKENVFRKNLNSHTLNLGCDCLSHYMYQGYYGL